MTRYSVFTKDLLKKNLTDIMNEVSNFEYNNWREENYLIDLPDKWKFSIGIFTDDFLSGFSFNSNKVNIFYIHFFYIFKQFRGGGIGKNLLNNCEKISIDNGIKTMQLKCHKNNTDALNFYFENKFYIKNISLQNDNYYLMEKKL